ncbi:MAG: hypothetical protein ACJAZW_001617 [Maritalea sp.]
MIFLEILKVKKETGGNTTNIWIWTIFATLFVLVAWGMTWIFIGNVQPSFSENTVVLIPIDDNGGAFGDKFGFITSLFSGLAFVGLVAAIFLQQEELKNTQKNNGRAKR